MQQHNKQERAGWVRLNVPLPPRLAELVGYCGEARWVALHWEPCGDESFYDDGRTSGTGAPWPYLTFIRHPAVAPELADYNLGSSDEPAAECLVLDRGEQTIYAATVSSARRFLAAQHPPLRLTVGQVPAAETSLAALLDLASRVAHLDLVDLVDLATGSEAEDNEGFECAMREERQAIEEMVSFLNQHV